MMQDYQHELSSIRRLLKENSDGMSVTDISRALGKNKNTIGRYLDILLISGQVDMRTYGMAKVYTLSQRVPLSAMLSYSKELIMVLDSDGRIVDINENFLRLMGLERAEVTGKNIEYLRPPDVDVHELLGSVSAGAQDGDGKREETVTFRIKGTGERIFNVKRIPTVFEDGGRGSTIIFEDMTEHILAEREIQQSEERFRAMAENIRDGLVIMEDGKNVFVNKRISEITGYTVEELVAIDPVSLVVPEERETVARRFTEVREEPFEGFRDDVAWIIRKDGERRCVYSRITVMPVGNKGYAFVILTDITELRAKEAALRDSEQRFRAMAENIRDGLLIIENNRVVFANRRMTEICGFPAEEIIKLDVRRILSEEIQPPPELMNVCPTGRRCTLEEAISNIRPEADAPGEATLWIRRKDGEKRCVQANFSALEHDGVRTIYITVTDITTFATKERALRDRIASLQELVS